jgi:hypothetical protein
MTLYHTAAIIEGDQPAVSESLSGTRGERLRGMARPAYAGARTHKLLG